jgi:hypothetical protein
MIVVVCVRKGKFWLQVRDDSVNDITDKAVDDGEDKLEERKIAGGQIKLLNMNC